MQKLLILPSITLLGATMAWGTTQSDLLEMRAELSALKAEVIALKSKDKKINRKLNKVKAHDAGDNIKWGVDLRTSLDNIEYTMADGSTRSNHSLLSTRLWLNMAYAPDSQNIFKGQLSYHKAFGADLGNNRGGGLDQFDWVTNEALAGDELKVRQAYWLYLGESAFGADIPWTFSVGRRPSTTGFLSNLREDDKAQSPLGHNIDVEFDGASSLLKLENVTGISGMSFKVCAGQGSTNAKPLFSDTSIYDTDGTVVDAIKLIGFIFVPYDDGQYTLKTNLFRSYNLPGLNDAMNPTLGFKTVGDLDGFALSFMVDGLMEDTMFEETKLFSSFAMSKTNPDSNEKMLGSSESETGTSYWVGMQQPLWGGNFGLEYNHGSKYWRSFTYAEDTMIGSKLATRGSAIEAYYTYQLNKALSAQLRYTRIDYDYTGSNAFFGDGGTPMSIADSSDSNVVDKAQDIRFYIRYRF